MKLWPHCFWRSERPDGYWDTALDGMSHTPATPVSLHWVPRKLRQPAPKQKSIFGQANPSCSVSSWAQHAVHRLINNYRTWRNWCACRVWEMSSSSKTRTSKTQTETFSGIGGVTQIWRQGGTPNPHHGWLSRCVLTKPSTFSAAYTKSKQYLFCSWLKARQPHSNWRTTCALFWDGERVSNPQSH